MTPDQIEAKRLSRQCEDAADYLDMCARILAKHPENDIIGWHLPVIERQFNAMDVLRRAAEHIKKSVL